MRVEAAAAAAKLADSTSINYGGKVITTCTYTILAVAADIFEVSSAGFGWVPGGAID
jgi:hypothetical protein